MITISHIEKPIQLITKLINKANSFIITTHVNPDGDAIGSVCAVYLLLKQLKKNVKIINVSPTPKNLSFLPSADRIKVYQPELHDEDIRKADVIFCLDFNTPKRITDMESAVRFSDATKIMVDHHTNPEDFYSAAIHDVDATSTGELIYKLIRTSFYEYLNADISTNIYSALMTDSGNFRFPRVNAETHYIVADLLNHGVDHVKVYESIFNTSSVNRMNFLGEALASLKLYHDGKFCVMALSREMYRNHSCTDDDTEGFVHHALSIDGVVCGLLIREQESGEIKFSFRSKSDVPASKMAEHFGGGGHFNAAGARVRTGTLAERINEAIEVAGKYLI